jgi:probable H4MPT-linked C1 transfer pathway protein
MPTEPIVGWDVGGAHLKAAHVTGDGRVERAIQVPCALWQGLDRLRVAIDAALREIGPARNHAITMTGELADLFANRQEGVAAVVGTMSDCLPQTRMHVYAGEAGFLEPGEAVVQNQLVGSANWRATAELVATRIPAAIVLDIGSTTTDIVPIADSRVCTRGTDDASRLISDELLYLGVTRTPLMALAARWPFDGNWTGICNEHFATSADVYRLTGDLPPGADQHASADNGPKTVEASARRLARMIGRDRESATMDAWARLAGWLKATHIARTDAALACILSAQQFDPDVPLLGAGAGRFLVREIARRGGRQYIDFADMLGCSADARWIGDCAPAAAVALLSLRV